MYGHIFLSSLVGAFMNFQILSLGMFLRLVNPEPWPLPTWYLASRKFRYEERFTQM
nr:hypothetical protein Iba_chr01dCG17610 [Ipomoea batatas]